MSTTCLRDEPGLDGEHLLTAFADGLRRTYTFGPPPLVGPALAEVLASGTGTAAEDRPVPLAVPDRAAGGFLGRLQGRRPRLVLGAAAASLTFLGVGAAGALPGPAQSAFDRSADAVGITLPAAATRDSTAPDARDPGELPGAFSRPPGEANAGEGEDAGPTVAVPPAGDRERAGGAEGPAAAAASDSAGPALGDVDGPGGNAGGRTGQPHAERPGAEHRPAPVPERGKRPEESGGPPSGVGPGGATDAEGRPGVGLGRSSKWHRSAWTFAPEGPTEPAADSPLGHEARRSAGEGVPLPAISSLTAP